MTRIRLIHWDAADGHARATALKALSFEVVFEPVTGPADLKRITRDPPAVLVIDLSRSPMRGRDVALALRETKAMRAVPLVFVEGGPAKVARVREVFPEAVYTMWPMILDALRLALAQPPKDAEVRRSRMDGYAGTPLPKKLGVRPGATVALIGAPAGIEATLGELPDGTSLLRGGGACDLALWFPKSIADLERRFGEAGARAGRGGMWVCWPKKAAGVASDLSERDERRVGLDAGWVDFKVCAIDATWSGLRFARRKA